MEAEIGVNAVLCQGAERIASNHQELEEVRWDLPQEPSDKAQPCHDHIYKN